MVTVRDIAEKCGVSVATVSKALNGYGDISPITADKIRKAAVEMNYIPNSAAKSLKTNNSHSIGILFIDDMHSGLAHEFFSTLLNAAKTEAESAGYDLTFIGQTLAGRLVPYLEHAHSRNLDGVLLVCCDFQSNEIRKLVSGDIPTVSIDYEFNDSSSVVSDNVEGGYALTRYLISHGHRRIAYIHGELTSVTKKRMIGFNRAINEANISIGNEYMIESRFHDPTRAAKATRELMNLPYPPTAIIYPDDYSYMGGMMELERMHKKIPDDVSTVGYDGIKLSKILQPSLTTWVQNTAEMGSVSMKKLIEAIENPKISVPETITIHGHLQEGNSVRFI
jgi:LacI family transcriptional regulator